MGSVCLLKEYAVLAARITQWEEDRHASAQWACWFLQIAQVAAGELRKKVMGLVPVTSKSATTWSALLRNKKEPCRCGAKLIYPHLSWLDNSR